MKLALCSFILISVFGCQSQIKRQVAQTTNNGTIVKLNPDEKDTFPKVAGIQYWKFVMQSDGKGGWDSFKVIDPRIYQFHHQYLASTIQYSGATFKDIEAISFLQANRKLILGTFWFSQDTKEGGWDWKIVVNLKTSELPSVSMLQKVFKSLNSWSKVADEENEYELDQPLYFEPLNHQINAARAESLNYSKSDILFRFPNQSATTKAYTTGLALGKLRYFKDRKSVESATLAGENLADTILLVEEELYELPPVKGVIVTRPLTEASHMVLLGQMYGLPIIFNKDALLHYQAYVGKTILVSSSQKDNQINFTDQISSAEKQLIEKAQVAKKIVVQVDFSKNEIQKTSLLKSTDRPAYGGKATQMGLIQRQSPDHSVPLAYGIPVSFFKKFITEAKTSDGKLVSDLIKSEVQTIQTAPKETAYLVVEKASKNIRTAFEEAQVSPDFFLSIKKQLISNWKAVGSKEKFRLKLRSSSNVEDGAEFNGAGLYESEGVCLQNCEKDDFEAGFRKVWGSLYTSRGLWARTQYKIDETKVAMAILAHSPYKNEILNGVAKFRMKKNYNNLAEPYTEIYSAKGDENAVANPDGSLSSEMVILDSNEIVKHRPFKSLEPGQLLMDRNQYLIIQSLLAKYFENRYDQSADEIEGEWKLIESSKGPLVHFKQIRAVPKPSLLKWTDQANFRVITGGLVSGVGHWPYDARLMPWKIESFKMDLQGFTNIDLNSKKINAIKAQNGNLQILGKLYPFKVKETKVKTDDSKSFEIKFSIEIVELGSYELIWRFYDSGGTNIYFGSEGDLSLVSQSKSPYGDHRIGLTTSLEKPDSFNSVMLEASPLVKEIKNKTCPISLQLKSDNRWMQTDNEYRSYKEITVTSKAFAKKLKVTAGYPSGHSHYQQHESYFSLWVDLFGDTSLTEKERGQILKSYGRYLYLDRGGAFNFYDVNMIPSKKIPGCGQDEPSPNEEDEQEAAPIIEPEGVG